MWKIFGQKCSQSNVVIYSPSHFGPFFSVFSQYTNEIMIFFKKVHFFAFLTLKPHSDHIFEIGQEIFHIHEFQVILSGRAKPWHQILTTLDFMSSWKVAKRAFRKAFLLRIILGEFRAIQVCIKWSKLIWYCFWVPMVHNKPKLPVLFVNFGEILPNITVFRVKTRLFRGHLTWPKSLVYSLILLKLWTYDTKEANKSFLVPAIDQSLVEISKR